ncbi:MAG: hypothetical protein U5K71_00885 [Gracilimonas sp.]|nr:hypothetical protein [Gracilimonas sp.]
MFHFLPTWFDTLCIGTKKVLRWVFFPIILLSFSGTLSAQTLQDIYSNLDIATSMSVTPNAIYIVEQGKDRLLKLDHTGKLLDTIGGRGSGDYQFSKPVDVDATNGLKIFITDQNNRRIQVFDRRGQFLSSISERSSFVNSRRYHPNQLSVSDLGEIYFWDNESRLIRRFDMDYNFEDEFRISSDIRSVDDLQVTSAEILILDKSTESIHRLSPNGGYSGFYPVENIKAFYVNEQGMWLAYENRVVYEQENGEIQEFEFEKNVQPIDIHVQSGSIFILTRGELFKIETGSR